MNTINNSSRFFVVTKASKASTLEDVRFETTLQGLQQQFAGGLAAKDILIITDDIDLAEQTAEDELIKTGAYKICPICELAKPHNEFMRTPVDSELEPEPCDECWREHERMEHERTDSQDRRVLEKYARFAFVEFADKETAAKALYELKARFPNDKFERTDNYIFFTEDNMTLSMENAIDKANWLQAVRGMTIPDVAIGPRIYNV